MQLEQGEAVPKLWTLAWSQVILKNETHPSCVSDNYNIDKLIIKNTVVEPQFTPNFQFAPYFEIFFNLHQIPNIPNELHLLGIKDKL